MKYESSPAAIAIFLFFVGAVLGLSFYLGRKAKSAKGYYAAHGEIGWFVNGIAFAGDYLSAASFLGICGLIAFYGYDGFLYSIGYLAGWIVALFVIAEPIKRLGKFTFADALDSRFNSRGIKITVAISTLVVSIFYLIPQMVGAGALIKPLLGLPYEWGVLIVGVVVTLIVTTAGMVSTTWVQFIKGSLLIIFCFILVMMILNRGLSTQQPTASVPTAQQVATSAEWKALPPAGGWAAKGKPYLRFVKTDGTIATFHFPLTLIDKPLPTQLAAATEAQTKTETASHSMLVNGKPQVIRTNDLHPVGSIIKLPGGKDATGPLGPLEFFSTLQNSTMITWTKEVIKEADGSTTTVYYQAPASGADMMVPGKYFPGTKVGAPVSAKLDFISLMFALFCGTASLPHILIRYYTVKNQAAARKSTIVGIAAIGFFYVLTLYLGLGAMTSGSMDPTDNAMAAPLLAKSFNHTLFAIISAIAFTTVLGTVSGLIMAGSGAVAHDLVENTFGVKMDDKRKVLWGKGAAIVLGIIAMYLGIKFQALNPAFLVGWAFNIAASANLPALVMLLFWKGTTKHGITASVAVGMLSSLGWILGSAQCYKDVYGFDITVHHPLVPFNQPALVTIPLAFVVLIVVSLMTQPKSVAAPAVAAA